MEDFKSRFGITRDLKGVLANPFTDRFTKEEIDWYGLPEEYNEDGVRVLQVDPRGRLDDYLNKNWRVPKGLKTPILLIDGKVWMSLTPMEIQSAYVPLAMAEGIVGTAGLGLGYFPLRAASSPNVEEVHVWEREPRVIDFFTKTFQDRPEFKKIHIHQGDVREEVLYNKKKKGPNFDFFFMDTYQTLLPDDVIDDIKLFEKVSVPMEGYRFWGLERVILDSFMAAERPDASFLDRAYLKTWQDSLVDEDDPEMGTLPNLYEPITDEAYRDATLAPLGIL